MAKKIYPGNWVNQLSSYQGQPVIAVPGVQYHHKVGYAHVDATGGVAFDVVLPSPDRRADDKRLADITGLVIPSGSYLYRIGLRVPDVRKDVSIGTATSGLVGTNSDRIKLASAATVAPGTLNSATTASGGALTIASTTIAPSQAKAAVASAQLTSADITLKVFVDNGSNVASSNALTSTATGGTYLICEVCYFTFDDVPGSDAVMTPFINETA